MSRPGERASAYGLDRATVGWLILWGLTVWAGVLVTIRAVGHLLLTPSAPLRVAGFFGATVPLMAAVTYPVYRRLDIERAARPAAAATMSIPGLLLDAGLLLAAGVTLPRLGPGAVRNFGAILLFGYAVVLLTGLVPRSRPSG